MLWQCFQLLCLITHTFFFQNLLPEVCKAQHVISMFLGMLETARLGFIGIEQDEVFGPIHIARRTSIEALEGAEASIRGLSWG
jgi:chromatin segregation and condensation protein Rec8/ScpA/Scc1 (kleisin family)